MGEIKVYEADITEFLPDDKNVNQGTERGHFQLVDSLQTLGAGRSLVADKNNKIPAGNKTQEAAIEIGLTKTVVIETDGDALIIHKRRDWDLDDPDINNPARQYAYRDNVTQLHGFEIDPAQLELDLSAGIDLSAMFENSELDDILGRIQPEIYDFSELDEELADLAGYQEIDVRITIPAMHKGAVMDWLANGESLTAPGMGKGVLKRCGLL